MLTPQEAITGHGLPGMTRYLSVPGGGIVECWGTGAQGLWAAAVTSLWAAFAAWSLPVPGKKKDICSDALKCPLGRWPGDMEGEPMFES